MDNDTGPSLVNISDRMLSRYRTCPEPERPQRWRQYQSALRINGYRDRMAEDDPVDLSVWVGPDCAGEES